MTVRQLVSIGMPIHNGSDHLAEAIESVLRQDYPHFELILCDNASEDDTEAICRRYVAVDARVRYIRNPTNIGFLPNFRRVLDEAKGAYFTWLAHDDLLSDPSYITALVEYLEAHPDVVACSSAFHLLDYELDDSEQLMSFPNLAPECWPESRREFFRVPHGWLDLTIYGVFRRETLAHVPIRERIYKGQPNIFWWETDLLTALSATGRIVALPLALRSYRRSTMSVGTQVVSAVSTYDISLLALKIKLSLIGRACRTPVSNPFERLGLVWTCLANLFRGGLRQPYDHRKEKRTRERELATLLKVADERSHLIDSLLAEILARRELARQRGVSPRETERAPGLGEKLEPDPDTVSAATLCLRRKGRRGMLVDFFSPPAEWQVRRIYDLQEHIDRLRSHCADQLQTVERLHSEAARLLELIDSSQSGSAQNA